MQISKWGNSFAIRLPMQVVKALGLKEGDPMQVHFLVSIGACLLLRKDSSPIDLSGLPFNAWSSAP